MLGSILFSAFFGLTLAVKIPHTHLTSLMLEEKIVGGKNTTIEEHPYQVSIELYKDFYCGGSLIRPDVVLTAAHCIGGTEASDVSVRAGSSTTGGGELVDVLSICKQKDNVNYDYDVTVLQLSKSLQLGNSIQTIALQPVDTEVKDGTIATVTGWGALSHEGSYPRILQVVQVPKISDATCKANYPKEEITSRMHCFGYTNGEKDACQGDSGGPLVIDGIQAGIVSVGSGCGQPNAPGVYTKIADESITNHINECIAKFEH